MEIGVINEPVILRELWRIEKVESCIASVSWVCPLWYTYACENIDHMLLLWLLMGRQQHSTVHESNSSSGTRNVRIKFLEVDCCYCRLNTLRTARQRREIMISLHEELIRGAAAAAAAAEESLNRNEARNQFRENVNAKRWNPLTHKTEIISRNPSSSLSSSLSKVTRTSRVCEISCVNSEFVYCHETHMLHLAIISAKMWNMMSTFV